MQTPSLAERMASYEPAPWSLIPDLGLYMDQVVTYIEQQFKPLYGAKASSLITPSMVNNYVKSRLLDRPLGKKYYREHLALLMMIVTLKPVASMDDISRLLNRPDGLSVQSLYEGFCQTQREVFHALSLDPQTSALRSAVTATAYHLVAEGLLEEN